MCLRKIVDYKDDKDMKGNAEEIAACSNSLLKPKICTGPADNLANKEY